MSKKFLIIEENAEICNQVILSTFKYPQSSFDITGEFKTASEWMLDASEYYVIFIHFEEKAYSSILQWFTDVITHPEILQKHKRYILYGLSDLDFHTLKTSIDTLGESISVIQANEIPQDMKQFLGDNV
jgi:hypothetical protein